jgi:hypothetical protein
MILLSLKLSNFACVGSNSDLLTAIDEPHSWVFILSSFVYS